MSFEILITDITGSAWMNLWWSPSTLRTGGELPKRSLKSSTWQPQRSRGLFAESQQTQTGTWLLEARATDPKFKWIIMKSMCLFVDGSLADSLLNFWLLSCSWAIRRFQLPRGCMCLHSYEGCWTLGPMSTHFSVALRGIGGATKIGSMSALFG